ncbi:MAG: hypothetical protein ACI865_002437 [Flavobacteriaceae bacterium]
MEFDGEFTSEHVPINEEIYSIILHLEKPSDPEKKEDLMKQMTEIYGFSEETSAPFESLLVGLTWRGDITLAQYYFWNRY